MGIHDKLSEEIYELADRLLKRLDTSRKFLHAGRKLLQEQAAAYGFIELESRASAVVSCCAELEALTKSIVQSTHRELNLLGIDFKDITPPLRQLAAHGVFESLRALQDHGKVWEKRAYASMLDHCDDATNFPIITKKAPQPPLDGRTLRPEHFNRIWAIYGLPGEAFPSASWAASLQKLALCRNDVAHGNSKFEDIFKQAGRSSLEIEAYLDDVGQFSIHFVDTWCTYMSSQSYSAIL